MVPTPSDGADGGIVTLTGGVVAELAPPRVRRADVLISDGRIVSIGDSGSGGAVDRGGAKAGATDKLDCSGRLILPGFACAHTHLYSALARGMPPPTVAPRSFVEILERVWWRLDRALDAETVALSALVGAIEALRAGCTTLIDHHASPGRRGAAVDGSLDLVGDALVSVGLRGVVCYETSERNGSEEARAGLRENERFLERVRREPPRLLRGLVGAHAAFTLSDDTAAALADVARRYQSGVHIHVAEDGIDARHDGGSTVAWLAERGLLGPRALLAHCVHVDDADAARIIAAGAHVVHNARSNANNAVGYARPSRFGDRLLLGTDGIGADMRSEAQAAFFDARAHNDPLDVLAALERSRAFAASFFDGGAALAPGAAADLIVLDYRAPTPLDEGNLAGHFLFGLASARVVHAIVAGQIVLRDGELTRVDEPTIYAQARAAATSLWSRL
jgi:putative selenium metabolism protein SsnA